MSYNKPSLDLIRKREINNNFANNKNAEMISETIEEILWSFGIVINVKNISYNSNSIFCDIDLGGVSVKSIQSLKTELELGLTYSIEILPMDSGMLRIAVKDNERHIVPLGNLLNDEEYLKSNNSLSSAIGLDLLGENFYLDIKKAGCVLVTGATGSGKTVLLSNILTSLLYKASPSELNFVLIDTLGHDLSAFNGLPHLLDTVGININSAFDRINWIMDEIDRRKTNPVSTSILVVIDEFSELILNNRKLFETFVEKIATEGNKVGIYLIISTQVPKSNIVTSNINSYIPYRISFVSFDNREQKMRSERLVSGKFIGQGDMFVSSGPSDQGKHIQGAYATYKEIDSVINSVININL